MAVQDQEVAETAESERRYRSLEELIQSQLSELTGSGVLFFLHHTQRLEVYAKVGSHIDTSDAASLKRLRWVEVRKDGNEWTCRALEGEARTPFLRILPKAS